MGMDFERAHKMVNRSEIPHVTGILLALLIAVIGWVGSSLISRVDTLSNDFNSYALRMENRVTALEQRIKKD